MNVKRTATGRLLRGEVNKTGTAATIVQVQSGEVGVVQCTGGIIKVVDPLNTFVCEFKILTGGFPFVFIPPGCRVDTGPGDFFGGFLIFSQN